MKASENQLFSEFTSKNIVFVAYLVRGLLSSSKVHTESRLNLYDSLKIEIFSENAGKNGFLAAYLVRGLFLCGQIAYGKRFGIVHSSEKKKFSETGGQNRSPDA